MKKRLPEYLNKIHAKKLSNTGHSISCSCPLHEDNNPSFSANQQPNGIWLFKCHSCSAKGSIIDLYIALKKLPPDAHFGPIIQHLEDLLGHKYSEESIQQENGGEPIAHTWLEGNLASLKQRFSQVLSADNAALAFFAKLLGLPVCVLQQAATAQVLGVIPAQTQLYTNRGQPITCREPRLVYMGQSHMKIRRPFGDQQQPPFMFLGHPTEPWLGEFLRSPSPSLAHLHESETSALALIAAGLWNQDGSSVIVSGHGAHGFKPEWAHLFKDKEVHLWPDADAAGHEFVVKVVTALRGVAGRIVAHDWKGHLEAQGAPWHDECKDVRDAFIKGGAEALLNVPGTDLDPALLTKADKNEAANPPAVGKKCALYIAARSSSRRNRISWWRDC